MATHAACDLDRRVGRGAPGHRCAAFDDGFVSLGRLKANQGNQNYRVPAGVDLRRHRNVVIWCRRFTYAFGAAALR